MPKTKIKKQKALTLGWEFIKLQIAGNIPFWGTYIMNAIFDQDFHFDKYESLLVATILANALFFYVDDRWVFGSTKGSRRAGSEIWRFVIFMSISALITFNITWQLYSIAHISPYVGQFISAALSILWTFAGLRFWVFAEAKPKKKTKQNRRKLATARR